jgi:hypothetical protein
MQTRIIKHEAVPKCGSYEVRYSDGRVLDKARQPCAMSNPILLAGLF